MLQDRKFGRVMEQRPFQKRDGLKNLLMFIVAVILMTTISSCSKDGVDGKDGMDGEDGKQVNFVVTNTIQWDATLNQISKGGDNQAYVITVIGDIAVNGTTTPTFGSVSGITVLIMGRGKLYLSSQGNIVHLADNQVLYIDNLVMEGLSNGQNGSNQDNNAAVIHLSGNKSKLELWNVVIKNNNRDWGHGGGVNVSDGTFIMKGNSVIYNNVTYGNWTNSLGGGVYVSGGTFIMQDTTAVYANFAGSSHGVHIEGGIFTMQGNSSVYDNNHIYSHNLQNDCGIGIYNDGIFTMQGKSSVHGHGNFTHGIGLNGGTFTMQDRSSVYDNNGSGVNFEFYNGIFTMQGNSAICGNGASGVTFGHQQGVKNVIMRDNAAIYNNTNTGVSVGMFGTFTMIGGSISSNTGGGVSIYMSGSFTKSGGGIIYGNDAGDKSNTVNSGNGHAVLWTNYPDILYRNTTLGVGDNISTNNTMIGWGQ